MEKGYKFRMYTNRQQETILDLTLDTCRHLHNNALADRKIAYGNGDMGRSYEDQAAILTAEKKANLDLKTVFSQVRQDVLMRLDKAFKNFFRRVKAG